ncbi:hypothetical protein HT136_18085 [Novosphingobium profundi]|uniref:hypothetical protein n=1 Tax=Novosphingobium profundi TaxID=1774954 RepID=UPI001BDA9B81|nr:hypothetical protein [Novosphingobium profundi]MBT0670279.1 hypothetical protein [Novosphingobium profundi]
MSVSVLAPSGTVGSQGWALEQVMAATAFGAEACIAPFEDEHLPVLADECRVVLVRNGPDLAALSAVLNAPGLIGKRRILALSERGCDIGPEALGLFACADMVLLDQACVARLFAFEREPQTLDELMVLRSVLTLTNQAAVVTLATGGAIAIWADRSLESVPVERQEARVTADPFCGIVAACVDLGIGPEPALRYALAGRTMVGAGARGARHFPSRAALDAERDERGG